MKLAPFENLHGMKEKSGKRPHPVAFGDMCYIFTILLVNFPPAIFVHKLTAKNAFTKHGSIGAAV